MNARAGDLLFWCDVLGSYTDAGYMGTRHAEASVTPFPHGS